MPYRRSLCLTVLSLFAASSVLAQTHKHYEEAPEAAQPGPAAAAAVDERAGPTRTGVPRPGPASRSGRPVSTARRR